MSNVYGYVAGVADSEKWNAQHAALRDYGIQDGFIVSDGCGVRDERPRFRRLVTDFLGSGDVLVIAGLDGLGRNQKEIFEQWKCLTSTGIELVILDMPFLDSYKPGDMMRPAMSDVVLRSFEYFAQYKYKAACQCQQEMVRAAKERGTKIGRARLPMDSSFEQVYTRFRSGEISGRQAAQNLNMSRSTFFRRVREFEGRESASAE